LKIIEGYRFILDRELKKDHHVILLPLSMESEAAASAAAQDATQEGSVSSPNTNNERSLSPIITPFNHSSLIGRRVAKTFSDEVYEGKIIRYHTKNGWGIEYDDGDYEDMNREQLEQALKLYEERQSDSSGESISSTHAAATGTPSSSPTSSTSANPKPKKRSHEATAEDEASQMLSDANVSEDNAKRLLNTRTKKRKEIQKQAKEIKKEVANAKKVLEEAQQRLAAVSEDLATAKSKENTAKKTLSMATKNREDIEGEIKPTMEPKSLFKEDNAVSANLKGGEEDTDDDDKKMKGEDTDDEDKKMAAVVTPPKKKRKKKMTKIIPLSDEEKEIIEKKIDDSSTYLIKFEEYLNNVDAAGELSKQNKRSVLRQVSSIPPRPQLSRRGWQEEWSFGYINQCPMILKPFACLIQLLLFIAVSAVYTVCFFGMTLIMFFFGGVSMYQATYAAKESNKLMKKYKNEGVNVDGYVERIWSDWEHVVQVILLTLF